MPAIGFFDSGIGGLTVLREARQLLPKEDYLYYADSDHAPYGTKSREMVLSLFLAATDFLMDHRVKAIVVACNTATSVGIEAARARYNIPVIGMEPAVKPALLAAKDKRVLVFATKLTLQLDKFRNLVDRIDTENRVDYLPLQELVEFAENFEFDDNTILPYLKTQWSNINLNQYGAVVLGCTHFPFFRHQFKKLLPPEVQIIDGNLGTVKNLQARLKENLNKGEGSVRYFRSGRELLFSEIEKALPHSI
ncbi:MAG: glutamate racemase [Bacteroidetes bacterium]|nr:glutamate racemase [Bacteroidota bacterium]